MCITNTICEAHELVLLARRRLINDPTDDCERIAVTRDVLRRCLAGICRRFTKFDRKVRFRAPYRIGYVKTTTNTTARPIGNGGTNTYNGGTGAPSSPRIWWAHNYGKGVLPHCNPTFTLAPCNDFCIHTVPTTYHATDKRLLRRPIPDPDLLPPRGGGSDVTAAALRLG